MMTETFRIKAASAVWNEYADQLEEAADFLEAMQAAGYNPNRYENLLPMPKSEAVANTIDPEWPSGLHHPGSHRYAYEEMLWRVNQQFDNSFPSKDQLANDPSALLDATIQLNSVSQTTITDMLDGTIEVYPNLPKLSDN